MYQQGDKTESAQTGLNRRRERKKIKKESIEAENDRISYNYIANSLKI